jgi:hypothetical protein
MANRETYPSALSPIQGDAVANAGATLVKVVGIQGFPVVSTPPTINNTLVFNGTSWVPSSVSNTQANQSILVNGVVMSDDYDIGVNLVLGIAKSPTLVNGS